MDAFSLEFVMNPLAFALHLLLHYGEKEEREIMAKKITVSDENFVLACIDNSTVAAISAKLGLKPATVASRANKLRKAGVNLPEFDRATKVLDVAGLNALIAAEETDQSNG